MNTLRSVVLLSVLSGLLLLVPPARADVLIDMETYAAVAYSNSTGKYGYAWNCWSRAAAERIALSNCRADDARIVGWVKGGWLALAIGNNKAYGTGWNYGDGAWNIDAKRRAVRECLKRADKVTIVICLCSGDIAPEILR